MSLPVQVECYAGYRGDERPLGFWLREGRVTVRAVVDRWLSENHAYFRVTGDDGVDYLLRRDDRRGCWEMIRADLPAPLSMEARS